MKILLDTHALLWWLEDDRKLGRRARRRLTDPRAVVLATVVSIWELSLKHRAGKFNRSGTALLPVLAEQRITLLDLRVAHLLVLDDLAMHHADPYDHIILAQAKAEDAVVMTHDERMWRYGISCIGTD